MNIYQQLVQIHSINGGKGRKRYPRCEAPKVLGSVLLEAVMLMLQCSHQDRQWNIVYIDQLEEALFIRATAILIRSQSLSHGAGLSTASVTTAKLVTFFNAVLVILFATSRHYFKTDQERQKTIYFTRYRENTNLTIEQEKSDFRVSIYMFNPKCQA